MILTAAHLAIHGYLLATAGQTVGKWILGIRIVSNQGRLQTLMHLMAYRYFTIWILSFIPAFGIADSLAIFRGNKKCVHDELAGTKVVRTRPG